MLKRALFTLIICFLAVFQTSCDEIAELAASASGCMLEDAPNYDDGALLPCSTDCIGEQTGSNCCCEEPTYGCMDKSASNYTDTADSPCVEDISGVATPNACCVDSVEGCMDEGAKNFNSLATVSAVCTYDDYGCINEEACNYNIEALKDCSGEVPADAASQNDDCCDLAKNASCYLDLNNNGYYEGVNSSANICNCGDLGVGWVSGDNVADDMEVQGCTEPTMNGQVCIEYNPAANVNIGFSFFKVFFFRKYF